MWRGGRSTAAALTQTATAAATTTAAQSVETRIATASRSSQTGAGRSGRNEKCRTDMRRGEAARGCSAADHGAGGGERGLCGARHGGREWHEWGGRNGGRNVGRDRRMSERMRRTSARLCWRARRWVRIDGRVFLRWRCCICRSGRSNCEGNVHSSMRCPHRQSMQRRRRRSQGLDSGATTVRRRARAAPIRPPRRSQASRSVIQRHSARTDAQSSMAGTVGVSVRVRVSVAAAESWTRSEIRRKTSRVSRDTLCRHTGYMRHAHRAMETSARHAMLLMRRSGGSSGSGEIERL